MESVGLNATIVMPILLLQIPFQASKPKDLKKCLDRRLEFWKNGNLESLMEEGIEIQNRLHKLRSSFAVKRSSTFIRQPYVSGQNKTSDPSYL